MWINFYNFLQMESSGVFILKVNQMENMMKVIKRRVSRIIDFFALEIIAFNKEMGIGFSLTGKMTLGGRSGINKYFNIYIKSI